MKKFVIAVLLLWFVLPLTVFAEGGGDNAAPKASQTQNTGVITIKLASLVPENTDWGKALNRMSKEWSDATGGKVFLQVYHNGVAGSESDVMRKLKLDQIQAAVITSVGLSSITSEVMTLSTPFLIRNDKVLNLVLNTVKPELEKKISDKGFVIIAWAKSGWVKIFAKSPVFIPSDLKRLKLGTSPDTPEMNQAFKSMGYQLVSVDMKDIVISLNSGMIESIYQSPVAAGAYQLFGVAKNMTDMSIAPFMGGIVMSQKAWRSIPDQYKPKIMAISKQIEQEIGNSITQLEDTAIKTMVSYGLIVNKLSPAQEQLWVEDVERAIPGLLANKTFDRALYEKINTLLREFRK
jgi:TRAP-type C4-dicarboxylate transport system substrate-binding protein